MDSGIDWIGEIPDGWEIRKFKYLHDGLNTGESIDKEYWTNDIGAMPFYTAGLEPIRTNYKSFPLWKITQENDLLLARNGTPYVYYPYRGACYSDHIIRAKIKKKYNKKFISYCLRQSILSKVVDTVSIATWSASLWNEQFLPLPPPETQQKIADILDKKCAAIDECIGKTKATIEKYKKLKQSIITEAVTGKLDKSHKMKNSGIEWIGEIPEHWEVRRIKILFNLRNEKNYLPLNEVNLISLYTDKGVIQHSDLEETTGNKAQNADGYKLVHKNDIVVNIILCWMGAIGRSDYDGVTSPAYDVYEPKQLVDSRYYHYYFRTKGFNGDCFTRGKGIMLMRWRTYSDQFRNISVLFPPLAEQAAIANYLDTKCAEIDSLIEKKQKLIEKLEQYKKSLIFEYVTGKKET